MTNPDRERLEACREWLRGWNIVVLDGPGGVRDRSLAAFVLQREEKAFQDGLRWARAAGAQVRASQREEDRQLIEGLAKRGIDAVLCITVTNREPGMDLSLRKRKEVLELFETIARALPPLEKPVP